MMSMARPAKFGRSQHEKTKLSIFFHREIPWGPNGNLHRHGAIIIYSIDVLLVQFKRQGGVGLIMFWHMVKNFITYQELFRKVR